MEQSVRQLKININMEKMMEKQRFLIWNENPDIPNYSMVQAESL